MSLAERIHRAEMSALAVDSDPSFVDPQYGRHSVDCWLDAHPRSECWCRGQVPTATPMTLASFAAAIGDGPVAA